VTISEEILLRVKRDDKLVWSIMRGVTRPAESSNKHEAIRDALLGI